MNRSATLRARRQVEAAQHLTGPTFRRDGATWQVHAYLTGCTDARVTAPASSILPGMHGRPVCWTGRIQSRHACFFLGQYATPDEVMAAATASLDAAARRRAEAGALLAGGFAEQRGGAS